MSCYEDQYRAWVDSLSEKQRAKLKAKGLDKPLDDFKLNTPDSDIVFAKMGEIRLRPIRRARSLRRNRKPRRRAGESLRGAVAFVGICQIAGPQERAECQYRPRRSRVCARYGEPRRQNRNRHSRAIRHYEGGVFRSRKIVAKAFGIVAVVVYAKRESVSGIPQCAAEKFDTPLMVCKRNFQSLQKSTNFTRKPSCSRNRQRIQPRRQYPLPSSAVGF